MGVEAAIIGGSLGAGLLGAKGSRDAARAQAGASEAGIAEQRRQFDTILGLTAPQRQVGNAALNVLAQAFIPGYQPGGPGPQYGGAIAPTGYGVGGGNRMAGTTTFGRIPGYGTAANQMGYADSVIPDGQGYNQSAQNYGDPYLNQGGGQPMAGGPMGANSLSEQFRNLPGAQFMVNEATNNLNNSFAARGGALSGNALSAIADRTSNMAANTMFSGLGQLAGIGNIGTGTAANAAQNQGNNISNLLAQAGAARASGIAGGAQSINNALQGGLSNWLVYRGLGG